MLPPARTVLPAADSEIHPLDVCLQQDPDVNSPQNPCGQGNTTPLSFLFSADESNDSVTGTSYCSSDCTDNETGTAGQFTLGNCPNSNGHQVVQLYAYDINEACDPRDSGKVQARQWHWEYANQAPGSCDEEQLGKGIAMVWTVDPCYKSAGNQTTYYKYQCEPGGAVSKELYADASCTSLNSSTEQETECYTGNSPTNPNKSLLQPQILKTRETKNDSAS